MSTLRALDHACRRLSCRRLSMISSKCKDCLTKDASVLRVRRPSRQRLRSQQRLDEISQVPHLFGEVIPQRRCRGWRGQVWRGRCEFSPCTGSSHQFGYKLTVRTQNMHVYYCISECPWAFWNGPEPGCSWWSGWGCQMLENSHRSRKETL